MSSKSDIISIINEKKAILSGYLAKELVSKYENTKLSARKEISRFRLNNENEKTVFTLNGLFSERQTLFLSTKINEIEQNELILKALKRKGKRFFHILHALKFHFGAIPKNEIYSYSVNPVKPIGSYTLVNELLELLKNENLISTRKDSIKISPKLFLGIETKKANAIHYTKQIVLNDFYTLFQKMGFVLSDSGSFQTDFFNFQFGFVGLSNSGSLPKFNKRTQKINSGFIVADIILKNGTKIQKDDVSFFVKKIEILKFQKNVPNFIPFLIVDSKVNEKTQIYLKENGIIIGFLENLFDTTYSKNLKEFITFLSKRNLNNHFSKNTLTKMITFLGNMRGYSLTIFVGYYKTKKEQKNKVFLNKKINIDEKKIIIDVFIENNSTITVCNCNEQKIKTTPEQIKKWLTSEIPYIKKWMTLNKINYKKIFFEFYSLNGFDKKCIDYIKNENLCTNTFKFLSHKKIMEKNIM